MIRGGDDGRTSLPGGRTFTSDPADLDPIDAEDLSNRVVLVLEEAGNPSAVGAIPAGDVRRYRGGRLIVDEYLRARGRG